MLVSVYRNGPLRNTLGKGYLLAAADRPRMLQSISGDPALRAALDRHGMHVCTDARHPAGLWIGTGPVWLGTAKVRAELLAGFAEVIAALAVTIGREGGLLLPSAARAAAGEKWSWLCGDRHAVEVVNERQREICSNLLRRWTPELIALSGRAAFGPAAADRHGSRRLADVADQLPARYIASASPLHLQRLRDSLRHDEGVSGFDVTDVDPVGDAMGGMPSVEVRCIDAQVFPATLISHALLLQAIAIKARRTEKDGGRIPAYAQELMDRNRSRAVATGLSAKFEVERERSGRGADGARRETTTRTAADHIAALIRGLAPELRSLEATAAELMPLVGGIALRQHSPDTVRTENDLFVGWQQAGRDLDGPGLHRLLSNREMLGVDQITRRNTRLAPGRSAVVEESLGELLLRPEIRDQRRATAESALAADLGAALERDQVLAAVRRHAADGASDLASSLRRLDGEEAKRIRRLLRGGSSETLRVRDDTDIGRRLGKKIMEAVYQRGDAFVSLELPGAERDAGVAAVDGFRASLPPGHHALLVTDVAFQDGRRVTVEMLVFEMKDRG